MLSFLLNILSTITGQLGPNYDPLFYDVMIYAYVIGGIIFTVIILVIILVILKNRKNTKAMSGKTQSSNFCTKCGNKIDGQDRFCKKCGVKSR